MQQSLTTPSVAVWFIDVSLVYLSFLFLFPSKTLPKGPAPTELKTYPLIAAQVLLPRPVLAATHPSKPWMQQVGARGPMSQQVKLSSQDLAYVHGHAYFQHSQVLHAGVHHKYTFYSYSSASHLFPPPYTLLLFSESAVKMDFTLLALEVLSFLLLWSLLAQSCSLAELWLKQIRHSCLLMEHSGLKLPFFTEM